MCRLDLKYFCYEIAHFLTMWQPFLFHIFHFGFANGFEIFGAINKSNGYFDCFPLFAEASS